MARIRQMVSGDVDAIMALAQRSPGAPHWTRGSYITPGERPGIALIAAQDGMLAGFAMAALAADIGELESIVVAEEVRRQGIGAALLKAVLAWARRQGARRMELEVRISNRAAIALYERAGFVQDGRRRGYYRDPEEDAVLMGLPLIS
jgi:ribosomal-protein-alanine N-acetyltransferase